MPSKEQLTILTFCELLIILYAIAIAIRYATEYWYYILTVTTGLIALRVWWRHRHPVNLDNDEYSDSCLEPAHQK